MIQDARPAAGPAADPADDAIDRASVHAGLTRQKLLRRLARLEVVLDSSEQEPVTVRSASGATASVRQGRWSAHEIEALLGQLGLSVTEFQDTR